MLSEDKENKLIELFICLDDFCITLEEWKSHQPKFQYPVTNHPVMHDREMLSILYPPDQVHVCGEIAVS